MLAYGHRSGGGPHISRYARYSASLCLIAFTLFGVLSSACGEASTESVADPDEAGTQDTLGQAQDVTLEADVALDGARPEGEPDAAPDEGDVVGPHESLGEGDASEEPADSSEGDVGSDVSAPECEQGTFCLDGVAGICTTSGQWQAGEDCGAAGLLCVAGSCRSPCELEAEVEGLAGCEHWALGLAHRGEGPFGVAVYNPSLTLVASVALWRKPSPEAEPEVVASLTLNPRESRTFPLEPADVFEPGRHESAWRIAATSPVIASQHSPLAAMSTSSGDGSMILPARSLGSEYMATGRPESRRVDGSRTRGTLSVLATKAGTQITLIPSVSVDAGSQFGVLAPGQQTLIPLQPYGVLHLTTAEEGGDLSGTRVYASQPVALFAGHEADRGAAPVSVEADGDHLEDALRPLSTWGRVHVVPKTLGQGGLSDAIIILAAEDDTLVQFDPPIGADFQIEAGEHRTIAIAQNVVVSTSRPVQIMQVTAGAEALSDPPVGTTCVLDVQCAPGYACEDFSCVLPTCEGALDESCPPGHSCECEKSACRCDPIGDAAWWALPARGQFQSEFVFVAPPTFPIHHVALLLPPETQSVELNAQPIDAPALAVGAQGYRVISLQLTSGPYAISADGPLGAVLYGFGPDMGYGHAGAQALRDLRGAECEVDADCPAPTSSCFGIAFCDTGQSPARCNLIAESSVNCAASSNPCVFSVCTPEGGASCEQVSAPDGVSCPSDAFPCAIGVCEQGACVDPQDPCDDGLFCNGQEFCDPETETCQMGTPPFIDDGIDCSIDACDESLGKVTHLPSPGACDDGYVCNGVEVCDLIKGCIHQSLSICDDGVFCNGVEDCDDVTCIAGTPPTIDDGVACTLDACNEALGAVVHVTDHAQCADENPCTIDLCDPDHGCVHAPELCDDGDSCTVDSCHPLLGCLNVPLECDDNDACTADLCDSDIGCVHEPLECVDGDPCTEDFCVSSFGCVFGDPCDDGDACTLDGCTTPGACTYEPLVCADDDPCTIDTCDVVEGCVNQNLCDDANACTLDECQGATCSNTPLDCVDDDPCTVDSCSPASGCSNEALDCSDGDLCTEDLCDAQGVCSNPPIVCKDDNACTDDICDAQGDCLFVLSDCDDGIACTADSCHNDTGCTNISPCDDGLKCTEDICLPAGGCDWAPVDCDDDDPCTDDLCDNVSGCMYTPVCGGE